MPHTKGPWSTYKQRHHKHQGWQWIIESPTVKGMAILELWDISEKYATPAQKAEHAEMLQDVDANARLIAAAPELLEALKRACDHLIMDIDRNGKGVQCKDAPDALVDFRILINKAEGKLTV